MKVPACAAAAMAAFLSCAPARAETTLCTEITTLPFTITVPGVYCLKKNLNVSLSGYYSSAITISAGNVIIDFNDFRINNQAPFASNQAFGVYSADRKNVTLKNGFIRGFYYGIFLDETAANSSANHLVEGMKVADVSEIGIYVEGDKSVIHNNRVIDVGGGSSGDAFGIYLRAADDGQVAGNIVSGIADTGENIGVNVQLSSRVRVTGNEVTHVDGGTDLGIALLSVDQAIIAENKLLNNPGTGAGGISDLGGSVNIVCRDNEAAGFSATPYSGCDFSDGNRQSFN